MCFDSDSHLFSSQGEKPFSEEEEEKVQVALSLDKRGLNLVLETTAFVLEQVGVWPFLTDFLHFEFS